MITKISDAEYRALDGVNQSTLSEMLKSPAHYAHKLRHPRPPSPDQIFGQAFHLLALEGREVFDAQVIAAPSFDKRTKKGKEESAEFARVNTGKLVLDPDDMAACVSMFEELKLHPIFDLLQTCKTEMTVTADIKGVPCKGKIDAFDDDVIIDVKTTRDASVLSFTNSIHSYRYVFQAAFYRDLLRLNKISTSEYFIIAIEKGAPHGIGIYQLTKKTLDDEMTLIYSTLERLKECQRVGVWPAYDTEPFVI